ncbi:MAG: WD40 repeat domain-containing protein [Saprospiraceae bacterium]|nr:WD40 repeat domain-containing protein [Saprospiraceae bacterium]
MTKLIKACLLLLCFIGVFALSAQDCYDDYLRQGKQAYDDLQFEQALNLFNAARICPDNLDTEFQEVADWITKANNGYIDAIKAARDAALASEERALKAQIEAERQATLSEARRLADLANQELVNGDEEEALGLSYLALSSVEATAIEPVHLAFGNAVARSSQVQIDHEAPVLDMGFTGIDQIWSRSSDGSVQLWDPQSEDIRTISNPNDPAQICVGNADRLIRIGSRGGVQSYDLMGQPLKKFTSHEAPVLTASLAPMGSTFATADRSGTINLSDETGLIKTLHESDPVHQVGFTKDGSSILVRSTSHRVRVFDVGGSSSVDLSHEAYIYQVSESPVGGLLLTAGADGKAVLWNQQGGKIAEMLHDHPVTHAVFSPDGGQIATADISGNISLWDVSGSRSKTLQGPASKIVQLLWAPNGNRLTAADDKHHVWTWESEATPVAVIDYHTAAILSIAYSPNSDLLLTTSQDGSAWLWNNRGEAKMQIVETDSPVYKGMFSPDGQRIVIACADHYLLSVKNPVIAYSELKQSPPQFTAEQKVKFGLN